MMHPRVKPAGAAYLRPHRKASSTAKRSRFRSPDAYVLFKLANPSLRRGHIGGVLVAEAPHLVDEQLNPLLDLRDVGRERCRTALLTSIDLVKPGDQNEDASHRKHDGKPQSQVPAAHAADSLNL